MAVRNITKFISSLNVNAPLNIDAGTKKYPNRFFQMFGKTLASDIVERDVHSFKNPLHGQFDLLIGNKIIDYKTGRPETVSDIAEKMDVTRSLDYYELQPFVYLSLLDDILRTKGEREFILFYALDNETEASDPQFNVMRNTRSVILLDVDKEQIIRSGMLLTLVTEYKSQLFIREFSDGFNRALLDAGIENASEWVNDEELFERILEMRPKATKGEKEAIRSVIKKAGKQISGCFIKDGTRILIPRESIEQFKDYAKKIHSRITEQQVTDFPCEPRKDCERCHSFHLCTGGVADDLE
jgi:hypothetical protein